MKDLSIKARIYVSAIIVLGILSLLHGMWGYHYQNPSLFAVLVVLGAATGNLKIRLPGIPGTVSISYSFIVVAMMLLGPTEAMILGGLCGLVQCISKPEHRPRLHQIAFSVSTLIISANLAGLAYHLTRMTIHSDYIQTQIIALVVATLVYFVANTLAVSGAVGLTSNTGILMTWYQNFLWTAACFFAGSLVASLIALYMRTLGVLASLVMLPPLLLIYYSYRLYLGRIADGERHVKQVEEMHLSTIEALALAIEAKDQNAGEHIQRVQGYAVALAKALHLDKEQIRAIREAALLHDVGKLAVPEYILCKPGRLTPREFEKISVHPLVGYHILSMINFQYPVGEIVLCHHERWDGAGYPNRLKQEQIPIGARVLAIVDCYEALISNRRYRKALSLEEAVAHIVAEKGKAFDPKLVDVFASIAESLHAAGEAAVAQARQSRSRVDPCKIAPPSLAPASHDNTSLTVYEAIGAANREISALYDFAQVVGTTLRLNETLNLVALKIKQILSSSTIAIYLLEGQELAPRLVEGVDEEIFRGLRLPVGQGISGWVAANGRPVLNATADLELSVGGGLDKHTYLQSVLAVPLVANEKVIGVLALYDLKPNRFEDDDLRLLDSISDKVAIAIRNSIIFEQTHEDALTDPITGLPNSRFLFMRLDQEISRARRNGSALTVLAMDLDNFKQINDTMGHLIGDKVLIQVGQLLRACLREYDFIARTGGDEFVALLIDVTDEAVARKIDIIQKEIANFKIEPKSERSIPLGISIGCSTYGRDGQDTDTLLTLADAAMYRSKRARKQPKLVTPAGPYSEENIVGFPR